MRLTLALIPLACALACTHENPAFLTATAADTSGTATSGTTTSGSAGSTVDPTQPATTQEPTTGVSTTGANATGNLTTDGNTTPPDQTTGNVSSGTTTGDPGSSSEPVGSTSGVDTGDPMMCAIEEAGHMPAPFMRPVDALNPINPISAATCSQYAGMELKGKLYIYPDGFSVKADPFCGAMMVQPSIKFPMPWMLDGNTVGGNGTCVTFKFEAHPEYVDHCAIASVVVFKMLVPILGGRFGTANLTSQFPNIPITAAPQGLCLCVDCCPEAPDPDTYTFKVGDTEAVQGTPPVEIFPNDVKHYFVNFRSDIHPECGMDPTKPNWLHFDWFVARAAG